MRPGEIKFIATFCYFSDYCVVYQTRCSWAGMFYILRYLINVVIADLPPEYVQCSIEQGSSDNVHRSNVNDYSEYKIVSNRCYKTAVAPAGIIL